MKLFGHHHHKCDSPWDGAPFWAIEVGSLLHHIIETLEKIMATLDETLAAVTAEDTKVDSIIALVDGLKKQLADALAGVTLPPDTQAKVDAIFAQANASAGKIDTAITANTPTP